MTLHERLKTTTRDAHDKIETNANLKRLLADDLTVDEYGRLLERYFGYFEPIEAELSSHASWASAIPSFETRLRSERLRQDLRDLGKTDSDIAALPRCSFIPRASDYGTFLGILYVLEGSNLGGRLIARHLARFPFSSQSARSFFDSDPARMSENWKSFLGEINKADLSPDKAELAAQAASKTFSSLDQWMAGERV